MAHARRYAPPRAHGAFSAQNGAYGIPFRLSRLPLIVLIGAVIAVSVSISRSIARESMRSLEVSEMRASLEAMKARARVLEEELVTATAATAKAVEETAAHEETRARLAAAKAEASRAEEEKRQAVEAREAIETDVLLEKVQEKVAIPGSGKTKRVPTDTGAKEVEEVFGEKAMSDVAEVAKVVGKNKARMGEGDEATMDDEESKEIADGADEGSAAKIDNSSKDIADVRVKIATDSATNSDPLLKNLAQSSVKATSEVSMTCNGKENTELWGGVVKDGNANKQPDAAACCDSCAKMNANGANRCSVWVYSASSKACWLKFDENPAAAKPANEGPGVPWTSGWFDLPKNTIAPKYESATGKTDLPKCLHVVMTSNGNVYMNWQSRVMYSSYLRHAAEDGSIMKAFTRILHKGREDELMHEIPTMRFNPVQAKCDGWCDYPVADRSKAVEQWLETADSERCSHVVMVETDHIIVKSPSPEILMPRGQAMGFKFGYMNPQQSRLKKMYPEYFADGKKMPPTGNAPSVVNTVDLRKIAPLWARFVNETESPESVRKELGWVRDMYAYDLAALATGIEHELSECPESLLMAQPPADFELGNAFILHYTWGSEIYDKNEEFIWKFDKRSYLEGQYGEGPYILQEIPPPPEWDDGAKGLQLQTFFKPRALTEKRLGLIKTLIDEFNHAVRSLSKIPKGYATIEEARLYV